MCISFEQRNGPNGRRKITQCAFFKCSASKFVALKVLLNKYCVVISMNTVWSLLAYEFFLCFDDLFLAKHFYGQ